MITDKYIIDLGNMWLINGNRFTKAIYDDDIDKAKQYATTLINCFGCIDCVNCTNCNHCASCNDCNYCEHCCVCNNCDKCNYCANCNDCSGCENIIGVNRIKIQTIPQHNVPMPMNLLPMQPFSYR